VSAPPVPAVDDPARWTGPVRRFPMTVEEGAVVAFRRAVGAPTTLDVPSTFAVVADAWDPDFARRPPPGRGWGDELPETLLHVEQWFEHGPPLVVGERVAVHRGSGRRWTRQGRSGALEFVEERTELVGADGVVRVATGWVDVRTETAHRDLSAGTARAEPRAEVPPRPDEVVLVEDLAPTQLVAYVGITGDLHPLHHDRALAQRLGYPDVFAPGMFTMAVAARAVTGRLGATGIGRLRSRFRAQVWPGDTLVASITDGPEGAVDVRTRNQFDDTVLETTAEPSPPR
jgi:acyl dehydratase